MKYTVAKEIKIRANWHNQLAVYQLFQTPTTIEQAMANSHIAPEKFYAVFGRFLCTGVISYHVGDFGDFDYDSLDNIFDEVDNTDDYCEETVDVKPKSIKDTLDEIMKDLVEQQREAEESQRYFEERRRKQAEESAERKRQLDESIRQREEERRKRDEEFERIMEESRKQSESFRGTNFKDSMQDLINSMSSSRHTVLLEALMAAYGIADTGDIKKNIRMCMSKAHPDKGGNNLVASLLNEIKNHLT